MKRHQILSLLFGIVLLQGCSDNHISSIEEQLEDNNIKLTTPAPQEKIKSSPELLAEIEQKEPIELLGNALGKTNLTPSANSSVVNISNNESVSTIIPYYEKIAKQFSANGTTLTASIGYITEKKFRNTDAALFYSREQGVDLSGNNKSVEYTIELILENNRDSLVYFEPAEAVLRINPNDKQLVARGGKEAKGKTSFEKGVHHISLIYQLPVEAIKKTPQFGITLPNIHTIDGAELMAAPIIKKAI